MMLRTTIVTFVALLTATPSTLAWQAGTPLSLLQPPAFVGNVNGVRIAGLPLPTADINCTTRQAYQNGLWGDPANFINMARPLAAYAVDNSGNWSAAAASVSGVGGGALRENNLGCLSEVASENYVPNSSGSGAAGGSPGIMPTGWTSSPSSGVSVSVSSVQAINGIETVTFTISGTVASGGGSTYVFMGPSATTVPVSSGQQWTISVWLAASGCSSLNQFYLLATYNVSGNIASSNLQPSLTSTVARFNVGGAVGGSNSTLSLPYFNAYFNAGAVNCNITVAWPQEEPRSAPSSPIVTSSGAVSRPADVGMLLNPLPFGPAFTAYASGTPNDPTSYAATQTPLQIDEGDNNSRWDIDRGSGSGQVGVGMTIATTAENVPNLTGVWSAGAFGKAIYAIDPGAQSADWSGEPSGVQTYAGVGTFAASRVDFGWGANANHQFDGSVARIMVWPSTQIPASILPSVVAGTGP